MKIESKVYFLEKIRGTLEIWLRNQIEMHKLRLCKKKCVKQKMKQSC